PSPATAPHRRPPPHHRSSRRTPAPNAPNTSVPDQSTWAGADPPEHDRTPCSTPHTAHTQQASACHESMRSRGSPGQPLCSSHLPVAHAIRLHLPPFTVLAPHGSRSSFSRNARLIANRERRH